MKLYLAITWTHWLNKCNRIEYIIKKKKSIYVIKDISWCYKNAGNVILEWFHLHQCGGRVPSPCILPALDSKASNLSSLSKKYRSDAKYLNTRSTYAKLAAGAVVFLTLIIYVRFWWL